MEGLPDFSIPIVLSFLRSRDICRCSCVAKDWASCAQERMIEMKEEAARARAQVVQDGAHIKILADALDSVLLLGKLRG